MGAPAAGSVAAGSVTAALRVDRVAAAVRGESAAAPRGRDVSPPPARLLCRVPTDESLLVCWCPRAAEESPGIGVAAAALFRIAAPSLR